MNATLTRTIRFCLLPDGLEPDQGRFNAFAGFPSMQGIGAYQEFDALFSGPIQQPDGLVANTSMIDQELRERVLPILQAAYRENPTQDPIDLVPGISDVLVGTFGKSLKKICWRLTPYYCISMELGMTETTLISQVFDFAASHRLHADGLTDEQNQALFGKCNNPNSHGHNYRLEVTVEVGSGRGDFSLLQLEKTVKECVIDRFDHMNLNLDTMEFSNQIPTVENIAMTCFKLLDEPVQALGAKMRAAKVWESERTSATYPAYPC